MRYTQNLTSNIYHTISQLLFRSQLYESTKTSLINVPTIIISISTRFKVVFSRCEDVIRDQITRDHLTWTIGNGDSMHGVCIPHRIPRAWEQQGWNKRKEADKNNRKREVTNLEERSVCSIRVKKTQQQHLASAEELTIELPERYST